MKKDLVEVYELIQEAIAAYFDTAYFTREPSFNEERRKLILNEETGPIFKEPRYEFLKRYKTSNNQFPFFIEKVLDAYPNLKDEKTRKLFDDFFKSFDPVKFNSLYSHQTEALEETVLNKRNIVVTTGTGSGKSYCFMIPMFLSLMLESLRDGWNEPSENNERWWGKTGKFKPKRRETSRSAAIRCLVMYPLNALVQDQVDELRSVLNSKAANDYFNGVLGGDRIYFGQYSGTTIGSGRADKRRSLDKVKRELSKIEAEDNSDPSAVSCTGSELLTRWDMQVTPPDILITNYTMLSIMLMREAEENMFEATREWLKDKRNVFYLVLDELHSYRGTGGTEVSFIIKSLIKKLGLTLNSNQLRIVCTSASLDDGPKGVDSYFLSDFFGTQRDSSYFSLIKGNFEEYLKFREGEDFLKKNEAYFSQFGDRLISQKDFLSKIFPGITPEQYGNALNSSGVEDYVIYQSEKLKNQHKGLDSYPLTISEIKSHVFDNSHSAAKGMLKLLSSDSDWIENYNGKIRGHYFVKNLNGLRRALHTNQDLTNQCIVYDNDTVVCPKTSSLCYESLYCQECGTLFYRGFINKADTQESLRNSYLPISPQATTSKIGEKIYQVIFTFNRNEAGQYVTCPPSPFKPEEFLGGWYGNWNFDGITGKLTHKIDESNKPVVIYFCDGQATNIEAAFPNRCSYCEIDWSKKEGALSPIRTMGTGYSKMSQIIVEQVMGQLGNIKENKSDKEKIVIFSDSRREAASISAELELNHYKDSVRSWTEYELQTQSKADDEVLHYFENCDKVSEENLSSFAFYNNNYQDASVLRAFKKGLSKDPMIERNANLILNRAKADIVSLNTIITNVSKHLVEVGLNPSGLKSWSAFNNHTWHNYFLDAKSPSHNPDYNARCEDTKKHYLKDLGKTVREIIAAPRGRDFESLGYGWVTYDRTLKSSYDESLIDSIIRFLLSYYRTRDTYYKGVKDGLLPNYVCKWLNGLAPDVFPNINKKEISDKVRDILKPFKITNENFVVDKEQLYIKLSGEKFWKCEKCSAIHLFYYQGKCKTVKSHVRCTGPLKEFKIEELKNRPNYYKNFTENERYKNTLRADELVGHTDKSVTED